MLSAIKRLCCRVRRLKLAQSDNIEVEGVVVEALPNANFRVELAGGHKIMAQISGKIRMNFIRIYPGDKVKVEILPMISPGDASPDAAARVEKQIRGGNGPNEG